MSRNGGRIGPGSDAKNGQGDTFCRTVIAALAAMLALKLCEYIRKWIQG
jgi:hypothetical protein